MRFCGTARLIASVIVASLTCAPAAASGQAMLVIDSSNSMWGALGSGDKRGMTHDALRQALEAHAGELEMGVISYGHRSKTSCRDIETLFPVGPIDAAKYAKRIDRLKPLGRTPMTRALTAATKQLAAGDGPAAILLVTDGSDNCGPDPCATAAALARTGSGLKIHVVALAVSPEDRARLSCIAANSGGSFAAAAGREDLVAAVGAGFRLIESAQHETPSAVAEAQEIPAAPVERMSAPAVEAARMLGLAPPGDTPPAGSGDATQETGSGAPVPLPEPRPAQQISGPTAVQTTASGPAETLDAGSAQLAASQPLADVAEEPAAPVELAAETGPAGRASEPPAAAAQATPPVAIPEPQAAIAEPPVAPPAVAAAPTAEAARQPAAPADLAAAGNASPTAAPPAAAEMGDPAGITGTIPGESVTPKIVTPRTLEVGDGPLPSIPDEVRPAYLVAEELVSPGSEALELRARITTGTDPIARPIHWTVHEVTDDDEDAWKLAGERTAAEASFGLGPGQYVVRASYGAIRAAKVVVIQPRQRMDVTFIFNGGGLRVLPALAFLDVPDGIGARTWVFGGGDDGKRRLFAEATRSGEVLRLNAGTYHLVNRFGAANAVVEADVTVKPGILTEVEINHKVGLVHLAFARHDTDKPVGTVLWQINEANGTPVLRTEGSRTTQILAPGAYSVAVEYNGRSYRTEFEIGIGETKDVNIVGE